MDDANHITREIQAETTLSKTDLFLQKGITLNDETTIQVIPVGKKTLYTFKDIEGIETAKYNHTEPLTITNLCMVGKEIKKHLNPDGRLSDNAVQKDFEDVKIALNEFYELYKLNEEEKKQAELEESEEELQAKMEEARELLMCKDQPLIYIASLVAWLTAGERVNIMLAFLCYCSQVILRNPISVIGLGEGSSGKTHIEDVALSLIPDEFIVHEKKVTEAAMFNRSKEDQYFYDGKIVDYGDLGGDHDQDDVIAAKNMLKEMQSDGYLNKPLSVATDEGWVTRDITLYGHPCLTYTTIPGFPFDDQEKSRSIFITPRMDNRAVFNARKSVLELKGGKTYKKYKYYEKEVKMVQYMVYLLRERFENIEIINPYTCSVIEFLGESEYFKRDFDKYNTILKTITAFNSYNKEPFELEGKKVFFVSLDDIQIFISLLLSYHASISGNITPKAAEILGDIEANFDEWLMRHKTFESGITVNQYFDATKLKLSKRSLRNYFGELNSAGFLKVVDTQGRANVYALSTHLDNYDKSNLLKLTDAQKELIKFEIGIPALDFIELDAAHDRLSIKLHDPDVSVPSWEVYDKHA